MSRTPTGKVEIANLDRAARLLHALSAWDDMVGAFLSPKNDALEVLVGRLEDSGSDEVVQPEQSVVLDAATGAMIVDAVYGIIVAELAKMGVAVQESKL